MGHSEFDPATRERRPWNAGRMVGAKRALKPQQVWAIRSWLERERRLRDRALFDFAIDSKLRGCDVVKIRIGELVSGGRVRVRATVVQKKTGRPVHLSCSRRLAPASRLGWNTEVARSTTTPSQAEPTERSISALGSMPGWWTSGSQPSACGASITARTRSGGPRHRSSTRPTATCGRCSCCWVTPRLRARYVIWASTLKTRSPLLSTQRYDGGRSADELPWTATATCGGGR
jgi:hypothetical protein